MTAAPGAAPQTPASPPLRHRPGTAGLLLLLAAVSLLADPAAVVPRLSYYFRDFTVTFYPLRLFAARELQAGRWPGWNPFVFEGSFALPYFHAFDLLHLLRCDPAAVSFLLTLQLPIAALCAFALARDLGLGRGGAFAAGAVFALGGLAQSSLNLYVFLQALAVAPLIVLTQRRASLRGGRWIPLAALALAVGLTTLAVEFVLQAVLLGALLGLSAGVRFSRVSRLAFAGALGFALAGVAAFPLLAFLPETERASGLAASVSLGHATPPLALLQSVIPNLFGSLADPVQVWWGAAFFERRPYFLSLYVGPTALALAFAGLPVLARRHRIVLLVSATLGIWFALGDRGGLAPLVLKLLNVVRYPSKALLLPYVTVAVLAGAGAHALLRGPGWPRFARASLALLGLAVLALAVVVLAPGVLARFAVLDPSAFGPIAASLAMGCGILALLCATGAALAQAVSHGLLVPRRGAVLVVGILVVDLARAHAGMNPQVDPSFFRLLPELLAEHLDDLGGHRVFSYPLDTSPAFLRFVAEQPPKLRLTSFFASRQSLAPYANVIDGIRVPDNKDLTSFTPRPADLGPEDYEPGQVARLVPWMRQATVSRVLSLDPLEDPDLRLRATVPLRPPQLVIRVYELARPAAPVYVACRALWARSREEAVAAVFGATFDSALDVALEASSPGSCHSGEAVVRREVPGEGEYHVRSDGTGWLVVRENIAAGWRATLDGREAPVLRANGKHRAVAIPGGEHDVVMRYHAPGLVAGAWSSTLAAVVILLLLLRPRGRVLEGEAVA